MEAIDRIASARRDMPLVVGIPTRHPAPGPLTGRLIAACLHLTPETVVLVEALRGLGARLRLCAANPLSTQDGVAAHLRRMPGVEVVLGTADWDGYRWAVDAVAAQGADLVIDDGADLILAIEANPADGNRRLMGACENTSTGALRLQTAQEAGGLTVPVFAITRSAAKRLYDDLHGTGQSVLDALLRTTNLLLAGRVAVVAGYGTCGRGIATRLRALGARIVVTEISPQAALDASLDGLAVRPMIDAIRDADLVVTATGSRDVVTEQHLIQAKDGVILANAGHFDVEIDAEWLRKSGPSTPVRPGLESYSLPSGQEVLLVAEGRVVNLAAAEGHPSAVMDVTFATIALCLLELGAAHTTTVEHTGRQGHPAGVLSVPEHIDTTVARLALGQAGVRLDIATTAQQEYLRTWGGPARGASTGDHAE
ncbi:MAG: adenosylhomocysteinase [Geodermatophilaceae bacterium]|nr:adenosylhomocysteinase [Geodermatophilaceae bacterium]